MTTPVELVIEGRDESQGAFASAAGGLSKIGQIAAGILTSQIFTKLAQGVKDFAVSIVSEAREAALVQADLNAVLQSTGGIAGVTAEQINAYADKMQYLSKFTDEEIIKGQTMLLQFTNIGSDVFPQASQAALDLATRAGIDLPAAFSLVGKALANPEEGIGRLNTQYKLFDDEQLKSIERMARWGDVAGAQKMILDELSKKVGGAAESQVVSWDNVKKRIDNIKESFGNVLLPVIDSVSAKFDTFLQNPEVQKSLDNLITWLGKNAPLAVDGFMAAIDNLGSFLNQVDIGKAAAAARDFVVNGLDFISDWWSKNGGGIMIEAEQIFGGLQTLFTNIGSSIGPMISGSLDKFKAWFTENGPLIQATIRQLADVFTTYVVPAITTLWNTLQPLLTGIFDLVLNLITMIMQLLTGDWAGAWETAKTAATGVFESLVTAAMNLISGLLSIFGTSVPEIAASLKSGFESALNSIADVFEAVRGAIVGKFDEIKTAVQTKVADIISAIKSKISAFQALGVSIVAAIRNGITGAWSSFVDWIVGMIQAIIDDLLAAVTGGGDSSGASSGGSTKGATESLAQRVSNTRNQTLYNFGSIYTNGGGNGMNLLDAFG